MVMAKYIRYSPEYFFVTGCNGKAYPERTIPIYIGRKSNHYRRMNPTMWKELRRNSPQEFVINKAVVDLGDPQVVAKLNRYRGKSELQETLGDILKEARKRVVLQFFSFALLYADTSDCPLSSIPHPLIGLLYFYDLISLTRFHLAASCPVRYASIAAIRSPMYDIYLRATHTTTSSIGGVQISIYLVSSTTDSL